MMPPERDLRVPEPETLQPCPGCGALFPAGDGPTHRYIGASPGCWALFGTLLAGHEPDADVLAQSRVVSAASRPARGSSEVACGQLLGDAYAVQHHGDGSPQAVQSVGGHLMVLHAALAHGVSPSNRLWVLGRALRKRGVFHELEPPPLGKALTIRHLYPGGGVGTPVSRDDYVRSVYETWAESHLPTIERWYARYVLADDLSARDAG